MIELQRHRKSPITDHNPNQGRPSLSADPSDNHLRNNGRRFGLQVNAGDSRYCAKNIPLPTRLWLEIEAD